MSPNVPRLAIMTPNQDVVGSIPTGFACNLKMRRTRCVKRNFRTRIAHT